MLRYHHLASIGLGIAEALEYSKEPKEHHKSSNVLLCEMVRLSSLKVARLLTRSEEDSEIYLESP